MTDPEITCKEDYEVDWTDEEFFEFYGEPTNTPCSFPGCLQISEEGESYCTGCLTVVRGE